MKQRESSFRGSTFHGGSTPKNILVLLPSII
nr:MAG TPA: Myc target protein 1 [Caudoviricetes sp.]DAN02032.1 MAG TPA: Myc target protein 1 [Caudoviricetes sp.]